MDPGPGLAWPHLSAHCLSSLSWGNEEAAIGIASSQ